MFHYLIARAIQTLARFMLKIPNELQFREMRVEIRKMTVPTPYGDVNCHVYSTAKTEPAPFYVNFHGGGFIIRYPEQDDHLCRYLAARTPCTVINVDYDVAPQKKFPIPPKQCFEVTKWLAAHAKENGWDGARLAVGGQSAGGALATAVCRQARDAGAPEIGLQIMNYPALDLITDPGEKHSTLKKPMVNKTIAAIFNKAYLPDAEQGRDPLASPADRRDLSNLPPALILTAELDTLRSEGDRYAQNLAKSGVPVVHKVIQQVDHAYTHIGPCHRALETLDIMADELRRVFR